MMTEQDKYVVKVALQVLAETVPIILRGDVIPCGEYYLSANAIYDAADSLGIELD